MTVATQAPTAVNVSKLGYVEFETEDVDQLVHYYTKVHDFVEVDRSEGQVFLTPSFDHHAVVVRQGAPRPRTTVGWEIYEDLSGAERRLKDAGYVTE